MEHIVWGPEVRCIRSMAGRHVTHHQTFQEPSWHRTERGPKIKCPSHVLCVGRVISSIVKLVNNWKERGATAQQALLVMYVECSSQRSEEGVEPLQEEMEVVPVGGGLRRQDRGDESQELLEGDQEEDAGFLPKLVLTLQHGIVYFLAVCRPKWAPWAFCSKFFRVDFLTQPTTVVCKMEAHPEIPTVCTQYRIHIACTFFCMLVADLYVCSVGG